MSKLYLFHLFLQVSDSGLAAVLFDQEAEGIRGDGGLLLSQTTQGPELRDQVALHKEPLTPLHINKEGPFMTQLAWEQPVTSAMASFS